MPVERAVAHPGGGKDVAAERLGLFLAARTIPVVEFRQLAASEEGKDILRPCLAEPGVEGRQRQDPRPEDEGRLFPAVVSNSGESHGEGEASIWLPEPGLSKRTNTKVITAPSSEEAARK